MKHFEKVVENDPLKLKNYEQGFGPRSSSRNLYILLALIPILLAASLALYAVGHMADLEDITSKTMIAVKEDLSDIEDT